VGVTLGGGVVELVYPPKLAVDSGPAGVRIGSKVLD